jgi:hypothetical protein
MKTKLDRTVPTSKPELPARAKRLRIEKLEERIAPKKGGNGTHNCGTANCTSLSGGGSGY